MTTMQTGKELVIDTAIEGELIDATPDCEGGFRACTNTDMQLVDDPYESDVNNTPGVKRWLCDACYGELCDEI